MGRPSKYDKSIVVECKCGCKQLRPKYDTKNRIREYVYGHSPKGRFDDTNARANHNQWNGGTSVNDSGYIIEKRWGHPRAHNGYVRQHVLAVEDFLTGNLGYQVYLSKELVVHHKNHNRTDNRIENLEVISSNSNHVKLHAKIRYGPT